MNDDGRGFAQPRSGRLAARQRSSHRSAILHEICRRTCVVFHTLLKKTAGFNPTLLGFAAEDLHTGLSPSFPVPPCPGGPTGGAPLGSRELLGASTR